MGKVLRREGLGAGAGFLYKAEAARSECEGDGAPDLEAPFASQEGAKPLNILAAGAGFYYKAEAARLECEGDGAPDLEALLASQEGAKPPNILANSIKKTANWRFF
ncbi:hypothetical protein Bmyc01_38320 [Bacillus mycoides]|nr:hypothetical protein Bmyc01_38320 [Bacillus mycoides]